MLVALEKTMLQQQRFVIAQDDIRKAFDYLPIQSILDIHRRYIQDEALTSLIEKVLYLNFRRFPSVKSRAFRGYLELEATRPFDLTSGN